MVSETTITDFQRKTNKNFNKKNEEKNLTKFLLNYYLGNLTFMNRKEKTLQF